jgi:hypothetical protein
MFEEFVKRRVCKNWGGVAHGWFREDKVGKRIQNVAYHACVVSKDHGIPENQHIAS